MFLRILKKDLRRKKAMNIILLMFLMLCSLFLSSSVVNLSMTGGAITAFAKISNTADYYLFTMGQTEAEDWIKHSDSISDYEETRFLKIESDQMSFNGKAVTAGMAFPYLTVPSRQYNLVFDQNDQVITSINDGEIAITRTLADKNNIKIGDQIEVNIGQVSKTLTVACITKDYAFGTEYMSVNRVLVSQRDYEAWMTETEDLAVSVWSISTDDITQLINEKNQQDFKVLFEFPGDTFSNTFYMEQISSGVILIVSVTLIVISLTLLRFTIRTTVEDDYREIGVMKAIGIKNAGIRRLYIVKYLAISVVGAAAGAVLSIPFTRLLTLTIRKSIVMNGLGTNYATNAICAAVIVALTMLFTYLATGKVKRMSTIQAIREGSSGERFQRKGIFHLKGSRHAHVPLFMARNDILSALRSYIIIFFALVAGLQLIILPFNAVSTLADGRTTLPYFYQQEADLYAEFPEKMTNSIYIDQDPSQLFAYAEELENRARQNGVEVAVNVTLQFSAQVYTNNLFDKINMSAWVQTSRRAIGVRYLEGTAPILENEIAMSYLSMENLDVTLGDKVHLAFGEDDQAYIITGAFETMSNGGEGIILSSKVIPDLGVCSGMGYSQYVFADRNEIDRQIEQLKAALPEMKFYTADEMIHNLLESVIDTMNQMIDMMIMIAIVIAALVVFLISNTLLAKDKGTIALMKSIGFSGRALRTWQTARIAITALAAAVFGVALSFALNPLVTKLTFGLMGATRVPAHINAGIVLGVFPGILVVTSVVVAYLVSFGVGKIDMRNVGSLE